MPTACTRHPPCSCTSPQTPKPTPAPGPWPVLLRLAPNPLPGPNPCSHAPFRFLPDCLPDHQISPGVPVTLAGTLSLVCCPPSLPPDGSSLIHCVLFVRRPHPHWRGSPLGACLSAVCTPSTPSTPSHSGCPTDHQQIHR